MDASAGAPSVELSVPFEATGRVRVHVPEDAGGAPRAAILVVHGYGRDLDELPALARAVAPGAIVLAPAAPSAFYRGGASASGAARDVGHGWIAEAPREATDRRNDAYLAGVLRVASDRWPLDPARTFLVGFSQGVGVAAHFWLSHPDAAAGLVGLAGGVAAAYRPLLSRLAGKPVLWVTGNRDRAYPPDYTQSMVAAWREARADVEAAVLETGHDLVGPAEPVVRAWLGPRLG